MNKRWMSSVLIAGLMIAAVPGMVNAKEASEITIAEISGITDEYNMMMGAGIQAACDEYGAKHVTGVSNGDAQTTINLVNTYVSQGYDAIISEFSEAEADSFRDAASQGVLIGSIGSIENDDFTSASIGYTQYGMGVSAAEYAGELVQEKLQGKAIIHTIHIYEGSYLDDRTNGFVDTLKEALGEDNVEVVSASSATDEATAMQQVQDALTAHPDINIIYTEMGICTAGAYSAVDQLELQDQVYIFAADSNASSLSYLLAEDDPIIQGMAAQDAYEVGYSIASKLLAKLTGEDTDTALGVFEEMEPLKLNKKNLELAQQFQDKMNEIIG